MARKLKGIRRRRGGWSVTVRVRGHLYTRQFPIEKPVADMRAWREKQIDTYGGRRAGATGPLKGDVDTFLAKPEIAAQPYVGQVRALLARKPPSISSRDDTVSARTSIARPAISPRSAAC